MNQMAMPNPNDFCTVPWAAEQIGVSERTVRRLTKGPNPPLKEVYPRRGTRQSRTRCALLFVSQVQEYARSRKIVRGG